MISLDFSILVTILYVAILYIFLSRFFFGPLNKILVVRRASIQGRLEDAERRIQDIESKTAEYESALREGRSEAYQHQESIRDAALDEKAELLADARRETETMIEEARKTLGAETAKAKQRLEGEIDALAARLSETLLQE
jgi:F-type H+-transporting ATPase subunit b